MSKTDTLDKIYKDPSHPAGFSSQKKLLESARLLRDDISPGDVRDYLSRECSYTRHGNVPKKSIKRRVCITEGPGFLLSGDLADMTIHLKRANDGVRFLMFLIDCYSRKLWVFITCLGAYTLGAYSLGQRISDPAAHSPVIEKLPKSKQIKSQQYHFAAIYLNN